MRRGKGILKTQIIKIRWDRPVFIEYGDNLFETNTKGEFNGIVVLQNRFIRSQTNDKENDFAFKIPGRTGWIKDYRKILGMLKKEDNQRKIRRQALRDKGLLEE